VSIAEPRGRNYNCFLEVATSDAALTLTPATTTASNSPSHISMNLNANEFFRSSDPALEENKDDTLLMARDMQQEPMGRAQDPDSSAQVRGMREEATGTTKVLTNDLRRFIRSKEDIYHILAVEGQMYVPPYDECPIEFLRDALAGRKLVIRNRDIAMVVVPKYKEFSLTAMYQSALQDHDLRKYLPEPNGPKAKAPGRNWLFNVISTVKPDYFEAALDDCMKSRRDRAMLQDSKYVEMNESMFNLIMNSKHVSTATRGKALSLLNKGSGKRSRADFEEDMSRASASFSGINMGRGSMEAPSSSAA
jgi:hypothetical protein